LSPIRRAYEKQWQEENPEQYREAKNQWTRRNPEYFKAWRNAKVTRKIAHALRSRLRRAVKMGSAVKNLGCSVSEFLAHLEKQFSNGMTWDNYGQWHIDHIKPLSAFDLTDTNQLAEACHFSNLQPLWGKENSSKHNKLDYHPKSARHANV
jgi:hypothetical protein